MARIAKNIMEGIRYSAIIKVAGQSTT